MACLKFRESGWIVQQICEGLQIQVKFKGEKGEVTT